MKTFTRIFLLTLFAGTPALLSAQVGDEIDEFDFFGSTIAVGDFNGDGIVDLAISAEGENDGLVENAGSVHILWGTDDGLSDVGSQTFYPVSDTLGFIGDIGIAMGVGLAAGDFNGDGTADLAIGAPDDTDGVVASVGSFIVLNGSEGGLTKTGLPAIQSTGMELGAGARMASGDINGDNFDDLVVSSPLFSDRQGQVEVYFGSADGITTNGAQSLVFNDIVGDGADQIFGGALSLGDFNNDTFADVAIGIPFGSAIGGPGTEGLVDIFYGSADGLDPDANQRFTQFGDDVAGTGETDDAFGSSLVSADFNMDGFDDLAVGAPDENTGVTESAGAVNIILGSADGLTSDNNNIFGQTTGNISSEPAANEFFGFALASADFNGDDFADLAVSAPGENLENSLGVIHILFGNEGGLSTEVDSVISLEMIEFPDEDFNAETASLGGALVTGDFNNDGSPDLVISASDLTVQEMEEAGAVIAVYGSDDALTADGAQMWHQNSNPTSVSIENPTATPFGLLTSYPNPFSGSLTLEFDSAEASGFSFKVYNTMGREVYQSSTVSGTRTKWDGKNGQGDDLPNGLYFIEISLASSRATTSVTLQR